MDSKFKDTPSEKLDMCLKQNFSPAIVDEFFACLVDIYNMKRWSDLYARKAEGRELNANLVFAYSDTLTKQDTEDIIKFLFTPVIKKPG